MGKAKEIVKLRFKKLKNGEKSAYFDIYRNGVREYLWQDERLLPELDEVTKENNQKLMLENPRARDPVRHLSLTTLSKISLTTLSKIKLTPTQSDSGRGFLCSFDIVLAGDNK